MTEESNATDSRGNPRHPSFEWRNYILMLRGSREPDAVARAAANLLIALIAMFLVVLVLTGGFGHFAAIATGVGFLLLVYLSPLTDGSARLRPAAGRAEAREAVPSLLQQLANAMPGAAIILGSDGIVRHFNDRALAFCPSLRQSWHISTCIRDPRFLDALASAPINEAPLVVTFHRRIPVEQRIEAAIGGFSGGAEDVTSVPSFLLVTLRDLSEQESLDRMRADFIANASHELRTPLASLKGFIETMQGPARNDTVAREKFLAIMAQQSKRMSRLIDDLLSLSRVEMKAHLLPETPLVLDEIVSHVIETLEPLAVERRVTLSYLPLEPDVVVRGDRDELVQVFQNLVHNAIKYGREGGKVEVGHRFPPAEGTKKPMVQICVKDDGPGIAPEHLPRLVERFYRVDAADSRQKGGTGLGLAIVKHVLNRHRGELKIASILGNGATFTVELPLLRETTETASPRAAASARMSSGM